MCHASQISIIELHNFSFSLIDDEINVFTEISLVYYHPLLPVGCSKLIKGIIIFPKPHINQSQDILIIIGKSIITGTSFKNTA